MSVLREMYCTKIWDAILTGKKWPLDHATSELLKQILCLIKSAVEQGLRFCRGHQFRKPTMSTKAMLMQ